MDSAMIRRNVKRILTELPAGVTLVAAAKTRTPEEVVAAVRAGAHAVGENYVQEAERAFQAIGHGVRWHFIGHLQKNKVKKAVGVFDVIETVDSPELAGEIDKRCADAGRTMDVLIEVNSGRERQKSGVMPEDVAVLLEEISGLPNIRIKGLMTMGPVTDDPELARPFFAGTRELFDALKGSQGGNVAMEFLSMGMSGSYKVALEEGANIVRIGTGIFGERGR